ncbi:DUF2726 domain-containing protein [Microbulbifer sp. ZKSA006]|uniref:DUF2726 domain-containing protein n=1 Tax=Microbulbifer sp. ZKSA006 TaxID=3243390 RepID=UPI004038FD4A
MDILITAIIAFIAGIVVAGAKKPKKPVPKKPVQQPQPAQTYEKPKPKPLDDQFLEASQRCLYSKQNLLNNSEKNIYWVLVKFLSKNYCINPQASLGEILTCENKFGYRAINSKRSDFVITNKQFQPLAVIEYQGAGHFQGNYQKRDLTKRNALKRARVAFVQISETSEEHIKQTLEECGFTMNYHA